MCDDMMFFYIIDQEFISTEVLKMYGLTKDHNQKTDWQKMLKFGRKKRDRVDHILVSAGIKCLFVCFFFVVLFVHDFKEPQFTPVSHHDRTNILYTRYL